MNKCNQVIHDNINLLLNLKNISQKDLIDSLSLHIEKEKITDFLTGKIDCDSVLLIAISKYFKKNINYFFEKHENSAILDKQKIIIELKTLLNKENYTVKNLDEDLLKLAKEALKKDIISISYASYILNMPIEKIMEMEIE